MSTTNFTPGPWRVEQSGADDYAKGGIVVCTDDVNICTMSDGDGDGADGQMADATLIASAPELLYALQHLAAEIPLGKLNVRKDFHLMNAHACALKAIHKATTTKGEAK